MAPCGKTGSCPDYPAKRPFAFALEVPKGRLPALYVTGKARLVVRFENCPLAGAGAATSTSTSSRGG